MIPQTKLDEIAYLMEKRANIQVYLRLLYFSIRYSKNSIINDMIEEDIKKCEKFLKRKAKAIYLLEIRKIDKKLAKYINN